MNLDDIFGVRKKVVEEIPTYEIAKDEKPLTIFDYLTDICSGKKGNIHVERDPEMKGFDSFMILRYLSMDSGFLAIINMFNVYQGSLTKQQLYKSLVHILPRGRKFLKYPKLKKKLHKAENVELISEYFKCSNSDALDYLGLGLLDQSDVDNIKISFGGRQK